MAQRKVTLTLATLLLLGARGASGQVVRGTTVAQGGDPVPGVVVLVVDSAGGQVARALGNAEGRFAMALPRPGRYELRTLRLGFRPATQPLLIARQEQDTTVAIVLEPTAVVLERIVVRPRRECRSRTDPGVVSALWNAARTALEAQDLAAAARSYTVRITTGERQYATDGRTVLTEHQVARQGVSSRAFASLSADSLSMVGYVEELGGEVGPASTLYRGPDAQVLLSATFERDHCFDLVASPDAEQRLLGLAFRPREKRRPAGFVDIEGTLWIDRLTSELRRIDFSYVGLPVEARDHARGTLEYLQLPTGAWVVRSWELRMPVLHAVTVQVAAGSVIRTRTEQRRVVDAIQASFGEVIDVLSEGRTLWTGRTARLAGAVRRPGGAPGEPADGAPPRVSIIDPAGGRRAVALDSAGHFRLDSLIPGAHRVIVVNTQADPSALAPDTITVVASGSGGGEPIAVPLPSVQQVVRRLCGREAGDSTSRVLVGTVRTPSGAPLAGAEVRANFLAEVRQGSGGRVTMQTATRETRADAAGRFVLCDVSPARPVQLRGRVSASVGPVVTVTMDARQGYAIVPLVVDP